jgi:hypothetical protein
MLNRHLIIQIFLTFVWLELHAAPKVTTQLPNKTLDKQESLLSSNQQAQIETPQKAQRMWAFYLQYYSGTLLEKSESYDFLHYGAQFSLDAIDLRTSISEKAAAISVSKRVTLLSPLQVATLIEPFSRYGLDWMLKTSDGLSAFGNTKRIQAFATLGLQDVGYLNRRVSTEAGVGLALTGISYHFLIGIHF